MPEAVRARARRAAYVDQQLLALCPATLAEDRPDATLAKRRLRYQSELFTFVNDPAVPPANNAAERTLRPLVVARKVSGGTCSAAGSQTRMILAWLAATARLQGTNPTSVFQTILTPPRVTRLPHSLNSYALRTSLTKPGRRCTTSAFLWSARNGY